MSKRPVHFMTRTEAAAELCITVHRVKQLAAEGRIGTKIAGRYLFTLAELRAFDKIPRKSGRKRASK